MLDAMHLAVATTDAVRLAGAGIVTLVTRDSEQAVAAAALCIPILKWARHLLCQPGSSTVVTRRTTESSSWLTKVAWRGVGRQRRRASVQDIAVARSNRCGHIRWFSQSSVGDPQAAAKALTPKPTWES